MYLIYLCSPSAPPPKISSKGKGIPKMGKINMICLLLRYTVKDTMYPHEGYLCTPIKSV